MTPSPFVPTPVSRFFFQIKKEYQNRRRNITVTTHRGGGVLKPIQQNAQIGEQKWRPVLGKSLPFHWPRPEHAVRLSPEEIWNNAPKERPTNPKPLAFYVHIPFCTEKCNYCDFAIFAHQKQSVRDAYVTALIAEIHSYGRVTERYGYELTSVYYGGGTPSVLSSEQLRAIDSAIRSALPVSKSVEYGFECNASDVTPELLDTLREMRVNRLSIGVQSFDDNLLRLMGRAHDVGQAFRAVELVRAAGFDNFNLDLIYGYPTETVESWQATLEHTFGLAPHRISVGPLSPLPHTELYYRIQKGDLVLPDVQEDITKFRLLLSMADESGYELGSYLSLVRDPRYLWKQQEDMLRGEDCAGVGISAFGRTQGFGFINTLRMDKYMETVMAGELSVSRGIRVWPELDMAIAMVHGFKLLEISRSRFLQRFGRDPVEYFPQLALLEKQGLVTIESDRIGLTTDGLIEIDTVMSAFYLPDEVFSTQA